MDSTAADMRKTARCLTALALFLSILVATLLMRGLSETREASWWVAHTEEVGKTSAEFMQQIEATQAIARAYVEIPSPIYKARYLEYRPKSWPTFSKARDLVRDNLPQVARFDSIAPLAAAKGSALDATVAAVDEGDLEAAHRTIKADIRSDRMKAIYDTVVRIQAEEEKLAVVRRARLEGLVERQRGFALADTALIALATLGALVLSTLATLRERRK